MGLCVCRTGAGIAGGALCVAGASIGSQDCSSCEQGSGAVSRAAERVEAGLSPLTETGVETRKRERASGWVTAPERALVLQRVVGNRAATRILLREPQKPASSAGPRVPKTYQVADSDLAHVAADPEMAERALQFRVDKKLLSPEAFGQNVAVVKYERDGKIDYLVRSNDPGKLHSEIEAIKELEASDPHWLRTQILEVYTERFPCANCWPNLQAVRERIKKIRVGLGKPATDFRIYYSVPRDEPGKTRAVELAKQYFSEGPTGTPAGSVTGANRPPAAPAETAPAKAPTEDSPKPPKPSSEPNPLHDPPQGKPTAPSRWDPTSGPPEGYPARKGPNFKPQPFDKPYKPPPQPAAQAPATAPPNPAEQTVVKAEGATATAEGATVPAERIGGDAAADLAAKAAGRAAEGLTFAEIAAAVGTMWEVIAPVLDVLFIAEAGYALGKALIFHNPGEMDPEQVKFMDLMDKNVMPAALKGLQAHEKEARDLALRGPENYVYAKVTMTITYGADGDISDKTGRMVYGDEELEDAQFNSVSVGYDSRTVKKDGGETHQPGSWTTDHRRHMQIVTFAILLNPLGQSRDLRRWVAMRANAASAIARGLSARSIAEGTHWVGEHMGPGGYDWTYLDDREEARRKKALAPSHRAEVDLAAKVAFTEAYIDAASEHMDQPAVKKLHDDAVQYDEELKRTRIDPLYGPVTKPSPQQGFALKPRDTSLTGEAGDRARLEQELAGYRKAMYPPTVFHVGASVGEDGHNDPEDVRRVSHRLHELGFLDRETTDLDALGDAIYDYQYQVLHMAKPDGRVDPRGATEAALRAGRKISMALP
jgi:Xanthomonas XOO_2897-like deaminase